MEKNRRKLSLLFALVLLLSSFSGCTKTDKGPKNYIEAKPLTDGEKDITSLISTNETNLQLFDYKTENEFDSVDFWVETYKDGTLVNSNAARLHYQYNAPQALSGEFAFIINEKPDFKWTLIAKESGGAKEYNTSEANKDYNTVGSAWNSITQPVEISDGKEIILYARVFQRGGELKTVGLENTLNPEYINEYEYVHVLKCKFSKSTK